MSDDVNPTLYVWLVDGEPCVGTLGDYAEHWEHAHYSDISISTVVWTFNDTKVTEHSVEVEFYGTDGGHCMDYTLTVNGITMCAAIDGCA